MPNNPKQSIAAQPAPARLIFQVAYDQALLVTRAELLKSRGYQVESALGNEAAKQMLSKGSGYHLFIVGHAADRQTREEIAAWIHEKFPGIRILALNPPHHPELANADINIRQNGPEVWLEILRSRFA